MSQDYYENLDRWAELKSTIKQLTAEERALREGLFAGTFPDPEEGTNKVELEDGRVLKAVHKIYRNVDESRFDSLAPALRKSFFRTKHSLITSDYRKADPALRKQLDNVLDIKPAGLPNMELLDDRP